MPAATANTAAAANLTRKFTRDSLMRASGKSTTSDSKSSQVKMDPSIQLEMARARAKSMSQRNALVRHGTSSSGNYRNNNNNNNNNNKHNTTSKTNANANRIILSGNPYRRFELKPTTTEAMTATAAVDEQSHAEILTTMSSLTEPTWVGPAGVSMSMSMNDMMVTPPATQLQQQQQQQQKPKQQHHQHQQQWTTDNRAHEDQGRDERPELGPEATTLHTRNSELREGPPLAAPTDEDALSQASKQNSLLSAKPCRHHRRSGSRDPGRHSRQYDNKSGTLQSRGDSGANPSGKTRRSRSMSVQPTRLRRRRSNSVASTQSHRSAQEDEKRTEVIRMSDMTSRQAMTSSTTATIENSSPPLLMEPLTVQQQAGSKPQSAIEAARMSLRPRLARSSSNRSIASMHSEVTGIHSITTTHSSSVAGGPASISRNAARAAAMMQEKKELRARHLTTARQNEERSNMHNVRLATPIESTSLMENSVVSATTKSKRPTLPMPINKHTKSHFVWCALEMLVWTVPKTIIVVLYSIVTLQVFNRKPWTVHRKNILLTGANTELGMELAQQLASEGAKLALLVEGSQGDDNSNSSSLESLAEACRELGSSKCLVYKADHSNADSLQLAMAQAQNDFLGIGVNNSNEALVASFDVVIINGQMRSHACDFEEIQDAAQLECLIKVNLLGGILSVHHALPMLKKNKDSRLVVLSSMPALAATSPMQSVFGATQHGLQNFGHSLRMELETTYGDRKNGSPKVCLVSLPEVGFSNNAITGTAAIRMLTMGATLPPAKPYSWATTSLPHVVQHHVIAQAIKCGRPEVGGTARNRLLQSLRPWCPQMVDGLWKSQTQQSYYRPLHEKHNGDGVGGAMVGGSGVGTIKAMNVGAAKRVSAVKSAMSKQSHRTWSAEY